MSSLQGPVGARREDAERKDAVQAPPPVVRTVEREDTDDTTDILLRWSGARRFEHSPAECGNGCGDPVTFTGAGDAAAVRCPRGFTSAHVAGPFYHLGCVPDDGRCGICKAYIKDRVVTSPRTRHPIPGEEWTTVVSGRWSRACHVNQGTSAMCYAAATAMVARAYNRPIDMWEVVHNFLTSPAGLFEDKGAPYRSAFETAKTAFEKTKGTAVDPTDTLAIQALMKEAPGGKDALAAAAALFGAPTFEGTGLQGSQTGKLTYAQYKKAIDDGHLVMVGYGTHWVVVYGYRESDAGRQYLLYADPKHAAATTEMTFSTSAQDENIVV
ncbi:hypothetical protein OHV05_35235 (plasmid) [Kitasatospora sp. NBC_00070]|uniref:hypothetical protein n=1 Tax=Kitasatospora sp. NBC_00070 TaxID=2975962 RepID=UPI003255E496